MNLFSILNNSTLSFLFILKIYVKYFAYLYFPSFYFIAHDKLMLLQKKKILTIFTCFTAFGTSLHFWHVQRKMIQKKLQKILIFLLSLETRVLDMPSKFGFPRFLKNDKLVRYYQKNILSNVSIVKIEKCFKMCKCVNLSRNSNQNPLKLKRISTFIHMFIPFDIGNVRFHL